MEKNLDLARWVLSRLLLKEGYSEVEVAEALKES